VLATLKWKRGPTAKLTVSMFAVGMSDLTPMTMRVGVDSHRW